MLTDYERHEEAEGIVAGAAPEVFEYLDDPSHLSAHMSGRSWMMGGGHMDIRTDDGDGRRVASRLRLAGRVLGLQLAVEGVVTRHEPPRFKAWETVGRPRLLVIGAYRMALGLTPVSPQATRVRVEIDYGLPPTGFTHMLGLLLGSWYARWCTARMVRDAVHQFGGK